MSSTDFLKKLTKEDKIIYSYAALTNLLCALSLAEEHDDYFDNCPGIHMRAGCVFEKSVCHIEGSGDQISEDKVHTDYDPDYQDYLDLIGSNLHNHYEMDLNSCYTNRIDLCEKIDMALI